MATEPTTTAAAASAAAGVAAAAPVLAGYGIDITTLVAAGLGVVVVQTLLPVDREMSLKSLAVYSIGSMVFSSLTTPLFELYARDYIPHFSDLREWHQHALTAATTGGFAQPMLLRAKKFVLAFKKGAAAIKEQQEEGSNP